MYPFKICRCTCEKKYVLMKKYIIGEDSMMQQ